MLTARLTLEALRIRFIDERLFELCGCANKADELLPSVNRLMVSADGLVGPSWKCSLDLVRHATWVSGRRSRRLRLDARRLDRGEERSLTTLHWVSRKGLAHSDSRTLPAILQGGPMSTPVHPATLTDARRGVYADILSQAVTGELIGMANYAAMAELCPNVEDLEDAVEHAYNERSHAVAFRRAARDLGVEIIENIDAPYWRRIREAFLRHVHARDLTACLIIQELMLETFAVSMYEAVADATEGKLSKTFRAISKEEEGHLQHALDELQPEFQRDPKAFERKVHGLHEEVMTILSEMVAAQDPAGHCGLCHGECVKGSLHEVGLSAPTLRGKALNYYLRVLDRLGIPGESSLAWVANLPE